jgi:hypothetical protein
MEDQDLISFLNEKQFDGVVAILCENLSDLITVENLLKSDPKYEKEYKIYNPDEPHNSKPEVVLDFMDDLSNCETKAEIKGNTQW